MAGERDYGALLQQLEADIVPTDRQNSAGTGVEEPGLLKKAWEFIAGPSETEQLESRGINTDGADLGVRAAAGMPTDPSSQSIAAMKALGEQTEFKLDRGSRRLLFKKPGDDEYSVMDPPGMDFGDFAEILGDVPAMTGETLGYLLSKRFPGGGKIWNAIKRGIGIGGGAATGEAVREGGNVVSGNYDHKPDQGLNFEKFGLEPLKAGGAAVGGAAVGRGLGTTFKGLMNVLRGRSIPTLLRERGLLIPEATPEAVREINRFLTENGVPGNFKPDSARLLNDQEFMYALDLYMKQPGAAGNKEVVALYEANQKALSTALEVASDTAAPAGGAGALAAGEEIQHVAQTLVGDEIQAIEGGVARATADAESAAATAQGQGGRVSSEEALGEELRSVAERENTALRDWADAEYGAIAKEAGPLKFPHLNLSKEADRQGALFDTDLSKRLTGENSALIRDIQENLQVVRETPTGGAYDTPRFSSFEQQQRLISQLKRAEREIDRGVLTGVEKSSLIDLRLAAMRDRADRLAAHDAKGDSKLGERLLAADKEYALRKDKASRGTLGRMMDYTNGRPRISNSKVFDTIFGTDKARAESGREFSEIITGDMKYLPELGELRRGVFEKFLRDNTSPNGTFNPDRAAKWLSNHEVTLARYMDPDQIDLMKVAQSKSDVLRASTQRAKVLNQALSKTVQGRVSEMAPSDVFKRLWSSPERIEEARRLLQVDHPQVWDQFRATAVQRVKNDMLSYDSALETKTVSFDKMNKLLDTPEYTDKLETLFGAEYVLNLGKIRDAASILARNPGSVSPTSDNPLVDVLRQVIFGPLDHRSFAFKAMSKYRHRIQTDNFMSIVLDPDALNTMAKKATTPQGVKDFQTILGGSVATSQNDDGPSAAFANDPLILGLQNDLQGNRALLEKVNKALLP